MRFNLLVVIYFLSLTLVIASGDSSIVFTAQYTKQEVKKEQEVKAIKDTIENKASSKIQIAIQNDEKVKEAISALQVLGYNRKEIEKAFGKLPTIEMSTEELIRKGLVALGK